MAPDTQTALALVSAEVGCLLTLASVAANLSDPHVTFIPVAPGEAGGLSDVHLRAEWREGERRPAVLAVRATLSRSRRGGAGRVAVVRGVASSGD